MTYFWVQIVHLAIVNMGVPSEESHTLRAQGSQIQDYTPDPDEFRRFLLSNPFIVDGQLWSDYYSKEVLMDKKAKEEFVLPDLEPLPNVLQKERV